MALSIDHFGHTSFRLCTKSFDVLIDPILVRLDFTFPRPGCPEWLIKDHTRLAAVFISHEHDDHLHPPSLLGLPPDVPVYLYGESGQAPDLLSDLGFIDVRPLVVGQPVELGEGVVVHALPAEPSAEGTEQCCFLVESPDALILDAVDIRDSDVTRDALKPYRHSIDIAFVPAGASVQWQGYWNQMDAVDAIEFCEWLQPSTVAPGGGTLSLADPPRLGALSRYPVDVAQWWMAATRELGPDCLLKSRPPYRVDYEDHVLRRCAPLYPAASYTPPAHPALTSAVLATAFTGYDPRLPTLKLVHRDGDVTKWAAAWPLVRDLVGASGRQLETLLSRCRPSANRLPAALLAPCTLAQLVRAGALKTAARLIAAFPPQIGDPLDIELRFFAAAEGLLASADDLPDQRLSDLDTCLWLDRRLHHLRSVHHAMKARSGLPPELAAALAEQHTNALHTTLGRRRPVLSPNHVRLTAAQMPLLDGAIADRFEDGADAAAGLIYPSASGVHLMPLSPVEVLLLDACDGRSCHEIADSIATHLQAPPSEVEAALAAFLMGLTRASVVLVDWSR